MWAQQVFPAGVSSKRAQQVCPVSVPSNCIRVCAQKVCPVACPANPVYIAKTKLCVCPVSVPSKPECETVANLGVRKFSGHLVGTLVGAIQVVSLRLDRNIERAPSGHTPEFSGQS